MQRKINTEDSISVVIPVYNSEKSIAELVNDITEVLDDYDYEIIMVDDYSSDKSFEKIKELNNDKVIAIKLKKNYGQQNAVKCGIDYSSKSYLITMDDDLQHRAEDIISLVEENHYYDVVYGIYDYIDNLSIRNLGSKFVNFIFNSVIGKSDNVRISSFRSMNRKTIEMIRQNQTSFVYLSAMIIKNTDRISNIKVEHRERKYGNSNYNYVKLIRLVIKLCVYYSNNNLLKIFRKNTEQYEVEEVWKKQ